MKKFILIGYIVAVLSLGILLATSSMQAKANQSFPDRYSEYNKPGHDYFFTFDIGLFDIVITSSMLKTTSILSFFVLSISVSISTFLYLRFLAKGKAKFG